MSNERRELEGLTVITDSGREAVCPKGGLCRADGLLEVPFHYREQPMRSVVTAYNADAATVSAAVKARAEAMDEDLDLAELVGEVI